VHFAVTAAQSADVRAPSLLESHDVCPCPALGKL
jgi:hypothetical protein